MTQSLPIFEIQRDFLDAVQQGPVVVTAPTGSGKSTELPRWLAASGRVLVIEPRRVACLGLCERVSFLEQCQVGQRVGYHVRGQSRLCEGTQILFVTPGMALRYFSGGQLHHFDAVVLDEFHERGIETDLLLALLQKNYTGKLVVTSATINAKPLGRYLDATVLHASGSLFDVDVQYLGPSDGLPTGDHLEDRVAKAVEKARSYPGDILVFLPGKGEIRKVADRLAGHPHLDVMLMHGDLGLGEQEKVFTASSKRKVVLATNVCETSITVPGIGVVIDSGLVKRTRFVDDRGFLTLMPVAQDSADQRKGRAGRTTEGVCFRLWSERAVLEKFTPAEMFRESLTQMVLSAASCGERMDALEFYESPKDYAVDAAVNTLTRLGALDNDQKITPRGNALFGLPINAEMAALLVDAETAGLLKEAIDVVSVAETPRELFNRRRPQTPDDDFRLAGCDVRAALLAMQCVPAQATQYEIHPGTLADALKLRNELREAFGISRRAATDPNVASQLAAVFVSTNGKCAYVARRKRGRLFFANGSGKEIIASDASAIIEDRVETIAVFATVATGMGYREKDARIMVTLASPLKRAEMAKLGVGEIQVSAPQIVNGAVIAKVERVHAGCVLAVDEEVPEGAGAVTAIGELFLRGRIYKSQLAVTTQRLAEAALLQRVLAAGLGDEMIELGPYQGSDVPGLAQWVHTRLSGLGIESGRDLALLDESDFVAPALPEWSERFVQSKFPLEVNLGDAQYDVDYDFHNRQVTLHKKSGTRKNPPSVHTIPAFSGFKVKVKHHTQSWVLRG